jgi:hypothetical protein
MPISQRRILAAGVLAIGLVGVATWSLVRDRGDVMDTLVGPDGDPIDPLDDAARERDERGAIARNLGNMREREQDAANRSISDPDAASPVDRESASRGFDVIMKKVERVASSRTKLEREEWDELYRNANDAFSALSMHLDATDPAERTELEEAHARLLEGLRRVRVRGNKKLVD